MKEKGECKEKKGKSSELDYNAIKAEGFIFSIIFIYVLLTDKIDYLHIPVFFMALWVLLPLKHIPQLKVYDLLQYLFLKHFIKPDFRALNLKSEKLTNLLGVTVLTISHDFLYHISPTAFKLIIIYVAANFLLKGLTSFCFGRLLAELILSPFSSKERARSIYQKSNCILKKMGVILYPRCQVCTNRMMECLGLQLSVVIIVFLFFSLTILVFQTEPIIKTFAFTISLVVLFSAVVVNKKADELITMNSKLFKLASDLKEISSLKCSIMNNVSHELRTPLTISRGSLELLLDTKNSDDEMDLINTAIKALNTQGKIIDNILRFSTIEAKSQPKDVLEINGLLTDVVEELKPQARKNDVRLIVKLSEENIKFVGNLELMKMAIFNIIENSIKFNVKGGKSFVFSENVGDYVKIIIKDTGIGIPRDYIEKIFDELYQIDHSDDRSYSGTGMGLAVAKKIINLHNGKIEVTSIEEFGTSFELYLPIEGEKPFGESHAEPTDSKKFVITNFSPEPIKS